MNKNNSSNSNNNGGDDDDDKNVSQNAETNHKSITQEQAHKE